MKKHTPRNKTLTCSAAELASLSTDLLYLNEPVEQESLQNRIVNQDLNDALPFLPTEFVDLLILDPPYNLTKNYNGNLFRYREAQDYVAWFSRVLLSLLPLLRAKASVYVCSDWKTSNLVFPVLDQHTQVRNRITWEREKGRGAKANWKNNTEDIWFCTLGDDYCFNIDDVKLKRRVLAPYRSDDGKPKDWNEEANGNYRLTHPSNIWADMTIPFWSMPENTKHPTQKPEKLIAKLVLASSNPGDFVFDPFLGSGTTAVAARKLNRKFCGVEMNREYCCWAAKRLQQAAADNRIQGYTDGVFWERNSLRAQTSKAVKTSAARMTSFNDRSAASLDIT